MTTRIMTDQLIEEIARATNGWLADEEMQDIIDIIQRERIAAAGAMKEAFRGAFTELLTLYALKVDEMPIEQARIHAGVSAALRLRALDAKSIVGGGT